MISLQDIMQIEASKMRSLGIALRQRAARWREEADDADQLASEYLAKAAEVEKKIDDAAPVLSASKEE